ncbi:MAG: sensor domain-containing diguanylate cyclase [Spirochaetales bacterium]|nr:sensor domain-containing diguanylate cyclase [Spirochaetales bacterium]
MGNNQDDKDLNQTIADMKAEYEKKIFDLQQLLEISKSLNSTLDYNTLMDSLFLTCMGQIHVQKIGLFTKKAIDHDYFSLHRNYQGFDLDSDIENKIPENGSLIKFLDGEKDPKCYTMPELLNLLDEVADLKLFTLLEPTLVIPLKYQKKTNGLIILGDRFDGSNFEDEDKNFILNIAVFAAIAIHNAFLFEMTTTDMMTKLKLRHYFIGSLIEHTDKSLRDDIPLSIIMMDIDHFKKLNDTYGHTFGDEVLKKISAVVREHIRQIDIAARYGGEEFIVLLPEADQKEAFTVSERIRQAVEKQVFLYGDNEVKSTISLGVAQFDKIRDHSTESLINRADQALYNSKHNGRNRSTIAE